MLFDFFTNKPFVDWFVVDIFFAIFRRRRRPETDFNYW